MNWLILGIGAVVLIHLFAIVAGRKTQTKAHRAAFSSGLLGLFSLPALIYLGIKSFCVAGMCRHVDQMPLQAAITAFGALSLTSAISVGMILARRSRA